MMQLSSNFFQLTFMKAQILLHIIVVVLSLDAELGEGGGESSLQYWYSSSSTLVHWLV